MKTNLFNELDYSIKQGLVARKQHPDYPLYIFNYTKKCEFSRHWTRVTRKCRGLITDLEGNIVARPFEKFFNIEEMSKSWNPPSQRFTVTEKMDGSLGIMYPTPDGPAIATRGSFNGMQAVHATEVLRTRYSDLPWNAEEVTYLFEIIYPQNRIVVDYGDYDDIVMLAAINTKTGRELPLPAWFPNHVPVVECDDISQLRAVAVENNEGFIIRYSNGLRLKAKHADYVRLHRLMVGVTARKLWECFYTAATRTSIDYVEGMALIERMIDVVPEEFEFWVRKTARSLINEHAATMVRIDQLIQGYEGNPHRDRIAFARYASQFGLDGNHMMIAIDEAYHSGRLRNDIWRYMKPAHEPFTVDIDG